MALYELVAQVPLIIVRRGRRAGLWRPGDGDSHVPHGFQGGRPMSLSQDRTQPDEQDQETSRDAVCRR